MPTSGKIARYRTKLLKRNFPGVWPNGRPLDTQPPFRSETDCCHCGDPIARPFPLAIVLPARSGEILIEISYRPRRNHRPRVPQILLFHKAHIDYGCGTIQPSIWRKVFSLSFAASSLYRLQPTAAKTRGFLKPPLRPPLPDRSSSALRFRCRMDSCTKAKRCSPTMAVEKSKRRCAHSHGTRQIVQGLFAAL